ncbi:hypothetical protein Cni_G02936 [Canna indica]|uniref:Aldose 1-epimerase n=1 Tax=Canna indica TaxID=4628 RepID=A0AAQ3JQ55_9LILI|nr:hypothetical protein Cni_G02936 [Canna indica]
MAKAFFLVLLATLALLSACNAYSSTKNAAIFELRKGKLADVVLGYDDLCQYEKNTNYFGSLVGRVANRISGAQFNLNGVVYKSNKNEGNNTLHGGSIGFSQVLWDVKEQAYGEFPYITFYYRSFDGEQGFPGALDVFVTYKISAAYQLSVTMYAKSLNKPTPVNLAQHTYWNLGGHRSGSVLLNTVQIFASKITTVDAQLIPTGKFANVSGTPYDFQQPRTIDSCMNQLSSGYDIYYVLNRPRGCDRLRKAAMVRDSVSGRRLELWTNQLGLQFYTANTLNEERGKGSQIYRAHAGLCLETQGFPDAVNRRNFPSIYVNPAEEYKHEMLFKFSF